MGLYENDGKRIAKKVRVTKHQEQKLKHIHELFSITEQRFFTDCIDYFYMEYLEVMSGKINMTTACKTTARKMLDDYTEKNQIAGITSTPYTREHNGGNNESANVWNRA